jgi:hypothetical protein
MIDFLSTLAVRARGEMPSPRPLVQSRFAAGDAEAEDEALELEEEVPARPAAAAERAAPESGVVPAHPTRSLGEPEPEVDAPAPAIVPAPAAPPPLARAQEARAAPRVEPQADGAPPPPALPASDANGPAPEADVATDSPGLPMGGRTIRPVVPPSVTAPRPEPRARPRPRTHRGEPGGELAYRAVAVEPEIQRATSLPDDGRKETIHVSIGRIEVRAPALPQAPPGPPPLARPKRSLDDYLAERDRGRR